jgi:radical SAM superfamily enzyme YgiQ (UPF0313 family)
MVTRVLLVNSNLKDDILAAPPIGMFYVATAADAAGHEVRALDLCFRHDASQSLETEVRVFHPDVIGISIRNVDNCNLFHPVSYLPEVTQLVLHARKASKAPIVLGGSGASLCPEEVLRRLKADFIVVSEGETSFVSLLSALATGASPAGIPGIGWIHDNRFHLTPPRRTGSSFGPSGAVRWIEMKPYSRMGSSYPIQTKRGCPQRCIYCTYNQVLEGQALKLRPADDVIGEMDEAYHRLRPDTFEFVDSVFNAPLDHCVEILEGIVRRPWTVNLTAMGISPRHMNPGLLDLMRRAGFHSFMMSPDSASDLMLNGYQKGFTKEDLVHAAEAINRTDFTVFWYFLLGGPGEDRKTVGETLEFVTRYLVGRRGAPYHIAHFFLGVRVYPGTRLWEVARQDGLIQRWANPLDQLWYLSQQLDLDETLLALSELTSTHPEVVLGSIERFLPLANIMAQLGRLLPIPKPYWRHTWGLNQLLIKFGLHRPSQPASIAARICATLEQQGFRFGSHG